MMDDDNPRKSFMHETANFDIKKNFTDSQCQFDPDFWLANKKIFEV